MLEGWGQEKPYLKTKVNSGKQHTPTHTQGKEQFLRNSPQWFIPISNRHIKVFSIIIYLFVYSFTLCMSALMLQCNVGGQRTTCRKAFVESGKFKTEMITRQLGWGMEAEALL